MVSIPTAIILACAGLFALFCVLLAGMLPAILAHLSRAIGAGIGAAGIRTRHWNRAGTRPRSGTLSGGPPASESSPEPCRTWWRGIEENVVTYVNPDGVEGCYLGTQPREILREENVSERYYHGSFYQAIPAILTGLGLMLTFVSILVALTGLHVSLSNSTRKPW